MPAPQNPRIYRLVHWQNVEHILRHGLCCRGHELAQAEYIEIGHRQLIVDRHEYPVKIEGYGTLGEYIPFYFAGHSPMLYIIKEGHLGVVRRPQNDLVYIVSSHQTIHGAGLRYFYTNMNAKIHLAKHYNDEAVFHELNWGVINSRHWNNQNGDGRKDFKQAEYLVHNYMPVQCIEEIVVYSEQRRENFQQMVQNLGLAIPVRVDNQRTLYY